MKRLLLSGLFLLVFTSSAWGIPYFLETASVNPADSPLGGLVAGSAPFGQTQFV